MPTDPPPPFPGIRLLFSLDPAMAHLDHAAHGATPLPVQRAQARLREELETNPARFFRAGIQERLAHVRRHLAAFLDVDPAGSALVANTDLAIATVLRSLALEPGDEIVTTDHGRDSVSLAVEHECRCSGARHRTAEVPLAAPRASFVAAVDTALTRRTRLLVVDHLTSWTVRSLPVADLVELAHERGVFVLVDATHAPGSLALPVIGSPDFWVGDLHRWAYAPRPTGMLVVSERWRARIRPLIGPSPGGHAVATTFPEDFEWVGAADLSAWLAAPAGLFTMRSIGLEVMRAHNAALAAYGRRVVARALGYEDEVSMDVTPPAGTDHPPMAVVELPAGIAATPAAAAALRQQVADELAVEVGIRSWRGRGLLRLSAQVYNRAADYDRLAAGLPELLRRAGGTATPGRSQGPHRPAP